MKQFSVLGFHRNRGDAPVDFFLTAGSIRVCSHRPISDVYVCVHPVRPSVPWHPVQVRPASLGEKPPLARWMFQCWRFRSLTRGRGCGLTLNTPPFTLWMCLCVYVRVCGCTRAHTHWHTKSHLLMAVKSPRWSDGVMEGGEEGRGGDGCLAGGGLQK